MRVRREKEEGRGGEERKKEREGTTEKKFRGGVERERRGRRESVI